MENASVEEETWRLCVAAAAFEAAGRERDLLAAPLEREERVHFFAVPDEGREGAGARSEVAALGGVVEALPAKNAFSVHRLDEMLKRERIPVAIELHRDSGAYGCRYTGKGEPISAELRAFTGADARRAWSVWFADQERQRRVLREAGAAASRTPQESLGDLLARRGEDRFPVPVRGRVDDRMR